MSVASEHEVNEAVRALTIPSDIMRHDVRELAQSLRYELHHAIGREYAEGGYFTLHADSTLHLGWGDAGSCQAWPDDHSGTTFDISEGGADGRDIELTSAEIIAEAALSVLDDIAELHAQQEAS